MERDIINNIVKEITKLGHEPSTRELSRVLRKNSKPEGGFYSKADIIKIYTQIVGNKDPEALKNIRKLLRMKPTRTISGVAPITIFTKPFPCPGNCIFCPNQKDMPKSYLREEPGAMRAEKLKFDPYDQTQKRIQALDNIGHNTEKTEIIISGGTWNHYPQDYREWYIAEVFRALNKEQKDNSHDKSLDLKEIQKRNESTKNRCVGLTIETRPDYINEKELIALRKLGVTKVQIGVQSLDNDVLQKNNRDHSAEDSKKAINLLRLAGFKIHIHWMANLHGSTIDKDYLDFQKLFEDNSVMPDELKIYPCSVVDNTVLKDLLDKGLYKPYEEKDLIELLIKCKTKVPQYCRITRLFRDIPSQLIKGGTTKTNLRQIIQKEMQTRDLVCNCIRCREIRNRKFEIENIKLDILNYQTKVSTEYFISYKLDEKESKSNNNLLGFLRLSLPIEEYTENHFIEELRNSAIIREVHVYGRSIKIGKDGESQHLGLGTKLIEKAKEIATENNCKKISVISAIGTKDYYRKRGFQDGELYQSMIL